MRRQRRVRVRHRGVFGPLEAVQQGLAAWGWQSHIACGDRLHLTLRQPVTAIGRRVSTLCQGGDGRRQPLALSRCDANCCWPPARVRQPRPPPAPLQGPGAAQVERPWTPARAAGGTAPVWTRRAGWLLRVPPGCQPPMVCNLALVDARRGERLPCAPRQPKQGDRVRDKPCGGLRTG